MCKILPTIFHGSSWVWYHSLESGSILAFSYLYGKLIANFSTNISAKKSSNKHLAITQRVGNKIFNKYMFKSKGLLEPVGTKALISKGTWLLLIGMTLFTPI